ncbi:MAG: nitroreductase family protein, partial [Collinsella sp.]|nr:nitroreductase family protein [Collinsella sp.]
MVLWVPFVLLWICLLTLEGLVMGYMDLARSRYSCRLFEDRSVEQAVVDTIVEAGRIAPSACNNHPTRVMVLDTPELLEKAAACQPRFARDGSIFGAPLIFL